MDWPLCVINANINRTDMRQYFITEKIDIYFRVFFLSRECLSVINVEGHAVHRRMASTTITIQ